MYKHGPDWGSQITTIWVLCPDLGSKNTFEMVQPISNVDPSQNEGHVGIIVIWDLNLDPK